MSYLYYKKIAAVFIFSFLIYFTVPQTNAQNISKIIALVNGIPITQTDFQNRAKFIQSNNSNLNNNQVSNQTIDELINDAIKISAAKDIGITYSEASIRANLDRQLRSQGTSLEDYSKLLQSNLINPQTVIDQRTAAEVWQQYIIQKYRRLANITQEDIKAHKKRLIYDESFHLQKLKISTLYITKSFELAENIINNFESCAKNLSIYKDNLNITLEDMFDAKLSDVLEPFATFLEVKYDKFILPIQNIDNDIIVMINCAPKELPSDFQIENELIGKQLEFFGEKELRNLRQDSIIDFKS
ncbi:MAG: SurA N-terminal domain-containing protein [Rhizobiales bacterium]|nr:SurA N-terminal domain-containing protein [Hyphomicrobiales bacterium]